METLIYTVYVQMIFIFFINIRKHALKKSFLTYL